MIVPKCMGLRDALKLAIDLGATVEHSDEWIVRHPSWPHAIRVHFNRHDASRKLLSRLRQLVRTLEPKR